VARVYRLTRGHPFYADVVCREAALTAHRLERMVSATHVDAAFLDAVQRPGAGIWLACREMFDSLDARAPALRGVLQALAVYEPATLQELAATARLPTPNLVYRYMEDLLWLGIVEEREGRRYTFVDPVFRYWVAHATDPMAAAPTPLQGAAARRAVAQYQEAYLRERELHGVLSEGYLRDVVRHFAGQRIDGRRLGVPGAMVALPYVDSVDRIVADDPEGTVFGKPAEIELDLCFGTDTVWLAEIRRRGRPLTGQEVALVVRKAAFLRQTHGLGPGPVWIVSEGGFTDEARAQARVHAVYVSTFADAEAIRVATATRRASPGPAAEE
jgi:hypothetical protein